MPDFHDQYKGYPDNAWWHLATDMLNGGYYYFSILRLEPKSILEVGAGSGKASVLLKKLLPDAIVVATDIDPRACETIQSFAKTSKVDVQVQCCDCSHLPFQDFSFDVCHSAGVIEHITEKDLPRAIVEHTRVAKAAIIEIPLLHWFLTNRSRQGDEIMLPKTDWLRLFDKLSHLIDFSLDGSPGEEITMTCLMSALKVFPLRVSRDLVLKFKKE